MALPTVVQSTGASSFASGVPSQTVAYGSNNTAGNTLIASGYIGVNNVNPFFTDSQGNVWQTIAYLRNWIGTDTLVVGCAFNCKAGANSVTLNANTGSTFVSLGCISEVSGVNAFGSVANGTSGSGTSFVSGNVTVPQSNSFLYCAIGELGSISGTSPFTVIGPNVNTFSVGAWVAEAGPGTFSCSGTVTTGGWGAILVSFYQANAGDPVLAQVPRPFSNTAATTQSTAYGINNTAGNFLALVVESVSIGGTVPVTAVTDSQGNIWKKSQPAVANLRVGSNIWWNEIWYAENCKAGANTVQWAFDGTSHVANGCLYEFANILTSNSYDQSSVNTAASTAVDAGPLSLVASNELVLSYMLQVTTTGITVAAGTNYAQDFNLSNELVIQHQQSGAIGTYHGDMTLSSSETWVAGMATFKTVNSVSTAPTISSLVFSQSDTTIVATWNTDVASDSYFTAGGKAAADNGYQRAVTSHYAIVTGLLPNTAYSCVVTSGGVSSSPQSVATNAQHATVPITAASLGSAIALTKAGDDMCSFVSNDSVEYIVQDDGYGLPPSGSTTTGHFQLLKITNENPASFAGSQVNGFAGFTAGGNIYQTGLFGFHGNLYVVCNQSNAHVGGGPITFDETFGGILKSTDYGATWNNWMLPITPNANGVQPGLTDFMFAHSTIGALMPVRYAADDGTIGYLTAGNRFDGGDGYIYLNYLYTGLVNNSNMYLLRIPRVQMESQNGAATQYWIGPASPTSADFVNDLNWSSSDASVQAIYSETNHVSWSSITFIPTMNRYLLLSWYYDYTGGVVTITNSYWKILEAPTPAGPWTQVGSTLNFNPSGWYNPWPLHRTAAQNTSPSSAALELITYDAYTGDNLMQIMPLVLTGGAKGISGSLGSGGAGATVSWSGASSGSVTADGSGNYNTGEVLGTGTYTIIPSKTGYTFSPTSLAQTVSGADITGVNFTATQNPTSNGGAWFLSDQVSFLEDIPRRRGH